MAVLVNHWPVWKNIYFDFFLSARCADKLPPVERVMTEEETEAHDYKAACKRCFLYIKRNQNEEDQEVEEGIADYYKGEAFIIIEEFFLSLNDLPRTPEYLFKALSFGLAKVEPTVLNMHSSLETTRPFALLNGLNVQKMSLFNLALALEPTITLDQFDQELTQEQIKAP